MKVVFYLSNMLHGKAPPLSLGNYMFQKNTRYTDFNKEKS